MTYAALLPQSTLFMNSFTTSFTHACWVGNFKEGKLNYGHGLLSLFFNPITFCAYKMKERLLIKYLLWDTL